METSLLTSLSLSVGREKKQLILLTASAMAAMSSAAPAEAAAPPGCSVAALHPSNSALMALCHLRLTRNRRTTDWIRTAHLTSRRWD